MAGAGVVELLVSGIVAGAGVVELLVSSDVVELLVSVGVVELLVSSDVVELLVSVGVVDLLVSGVVLDVGACVDVATSTQAPTSSTCARANQVCLDAKSMHKHKRQGLNAHIHETITPQTSSCTHLISGPVFEHVDRTLSAQFCSRVTPSAVARKSCVADTIRGGIAPRHRV